MALVVRWTIKSIVDRKAWKIGSHDGMTLRILGFPKDFDDVISYGRLLTENLTLILSRFFRSTFLWNIVFSHEI